MSLATHPAGSMQTSPKLQLTNDSALDQNPEEEKEKRSQDSVRDDDNPTDVDNFSDSELDDAEDSPEDNDRDAKPDNDDATSEISAAGSSSIVSGTGKASAADPDVESGEGEENDDDDDDLTSQADVSDSEDGSVSDNYTPDSEIEALRQEAYNQMVQIELDFSKVRETLYRERLSHITLEEMQIHQGSHPELSSRMAEIEKKRSERLLRAEAWKKQLIESYENQYLAIKHHLECAFYDERGNLRKQLLDERFLKIYQLKSEKRKLDTYEVQLDPPDKTTLARRKKARQEECAEYRIIQNTIGFPVPTLNGLSSKEIDRDLEYLGLSKPAQVIRSDIYIEAIGSERVLHYHGHTFKIMDQVSIIDSASQAVFTVRLVNIGDFEVTGQRPDGSRTKINLNSLETRKNILKPIFHSNSSQPMPKAPSNYSYYEEYPGLEPSYYAEAMMDPRMTSRSRNLPSYNAHEVTQRNSVIPMETGFSHSAPVNS